MAGETADSDAGRVLADLWRAIDAVMAAADLSSRAGRVVEIAASPVVVTVLEGTEDGGRSLARLAPTPALCEAMAAFLTAGCRQLPPALRRQLAHIVEQGGALAVILDLQAGTATAVVSRDGMRVALFALAVPVTAH